jgi:2-polyprenyl-3-methyl-5-hydroxy-6-metoxy-1,4-benzoquinol methylase
MGGSFAMAMGYVGDRLGLFRAMAGQGPLSSDELASKTELNERYVREWAKGMVAAEYIDYDAESGKFLMTEEQACVLTNEDSPMFVGGALQFTMPTAANAEKLLDIFKNGGGIPYSEIGAEIPEAIERFFRPGYVNFLTSDWLGAVPGLTDRLTAGASILDVGCGCGQSSVAMAKAFPKSTVHGVDPDGPSIERAKKLAAQEGVSNVNFEVGKAEEAKAGANHDLVCTFDCVHDMVDPIGALKAIRGSLSDDGVHFWSEPNASDQPLENRNLVGRAFANISPLHCMTVSLAHGGAGLGTIIGEVGAKKLADEAGFSRFEKLAIDNPFNQFFALRK